jgi:hypothetical protein
MRKHHNEKFLNLVDADSAGSFEDFEIEKCHFESCYLSSTLDPKLRTWVKNVHLLNCSQKNSVVNCAIIENSTIENLKTKTLLQFWGAVFNEVVFKGNVGSIMISPLVHTASAPAEVQKMFEKENNAYYKKVKWAIDISQASFEECDIRGLSSKLIIRDQSTQMILTREKAEEIDWEDLNLENEKYFAIIVNMMLKKNYDDTVIVAPKANKRFESILKDLKKLKKENIVE